MEYQTGPWRHRSSGAGMRSRKAIAQGASCAKPVMEPASSRRTPQLGGFLAKLSSYPSHHLRGKPMKGKIALAAVTLSLISSQAHAGEHRGGDAALGALSGAVVFGPIGAVAGAVVGYSAGPSIAHAWGFWRSHSGPRRTRSARQEAPQAPENRAPQAAPTAPQA